MLENFNEDKRKNFMTQFSDLVREMLIFFKELMNFRFVHCCRLFF